MKNLLMIIPFFPPNAGGGVYRSLGFVKYLDNFGWRPTVLTPRARSFWIVDDTLLGDVPSTVELRRTRTLSGQYLLAAARRMTGRTGPSQVRSSRGFALLRRLGAFALLPDTYIGWYPFAVREGRKLLRSAKFDAIYSTSPPETSHLIARKLHELSGVPWVADFRDPWMNLHLFKPPTAIHARIHARLEKTVCLDAAVVVTNCWHEELLRRRYPALRKLVLIGNGYDHEKLGALFDLRPVRDRFQILHAGMLTQKRSAVPFLKGLSAFLDQVPEARERCRVVFLGARESENEMAVHDLGLEGVVEFRDTVAHDESLKMERTSHILLLIKHSDAAYRGIVPGKLYEYIGARRPILSVAPDGEANDLILRLNRGETAPQGDPRGIAASIATLYDKYRRKSLERDYDLSEASEFTREAQTRLLAEYLDSVRSDRS